MKRILSGIVLGGLLAVTTLDAANQTKSNAADGQIYVWVPPGSFAMGCSSSDRECTRLDPRPQMVAMAQGFWIAESEVTVAAYRRYATRAHISLPPAPPFNP